MREREGTREREGGREAGGGRERERKRESGKTARERASEGVHN